MALFSTFRSASKSILEVIMSRVVMVELNGQAVLLVEMRRADLVSSGMSIFLRDEGTDIIKILRSSREMDHTLANDLSCNVVEVVRFGDVFIFRIHSNVSERKYLSPPTAEEEALAKMFEE